MLPRRKGFHPEQAGAGEGNNSHPTGIKGGDGGRAAKDMEEKDGESRKQHEARDEAALDPHQQQQPPVHFPDEQGLAIDCNGRQRLISEANSSPTPTTSIVESEGQWERGGEGEEEGEGAERDNASIGGGGGGGGGGRGRGGSGSGSGSQTLLIEGKAGPRSGGGESMQSRTPRTPRTPSSIPPTASATPSQSYPMPSFALGPGLTPEPMGVCTPRRPATRGRMQRPATHRGVAAIEREIELVTAEDDERASEWPRQEQAARSSVSGERLWTAEERTRLRSGPETLSYSVDQFRADLIRAGMSELQIQGQRGATAGFAIRQRGVTSSSPLVEASRGHLLRDQSQKRQVGGGGMKGRVMHRSGWFISRESGRGSKAEGTKKVDLGTAATITRGIISNPIERLPSTQSTKEFIKARHLESIVSKTASPGHAAHEAAMAKMASMKILGRGAVPQWSDTKQWLDVHAPASSPEEKMEERDKIAGHKMRLDLSPVLQQQHQEQQQQQQQQHRHGHAESGHRRPYTERGSSRAPNGAGAFASAPSSLGDRGGAATARGPPVRLASDRGQQSKGGEGRHIYFEVSSKIEVGDEKGMRMDSEPRTNMHMPPRHGKLIGNLGAGLVGREGVANPHIALADRFDGVIREVGVKVSIGGRIAADLVSIGSDASGNGLLLLSTWQKTGRIDIEVSVDGLAAGYQGIDSSFHRTHYIPIVGLQHGLRLCRIRGRPVAAGWNGDGVPWGPWCDEVAVFVSPPGAVHGLRHRRVRALLSSPASEMEKRGGAHRERKKKVRCETEEEAVVEDEDDDVVDDDHDDDADDDVDARKEIYDDDEEEEEMRMLEEEVPVEWTFILPEVDAEASERRRKTPAGARGAVASQHEGDIWGGRGKAVPGWKDDGLVLNRVHFEELERQRQLESVMVARRRRDAASILSALDKLSPGGGESARAGRMAPQGASRRAAGMRRDFGAEKGLGLKLAAPARPPPPDGQLAKPSPRHMYVHKKALMSKVAVPRSPPSNAVFKGAHVLEAKAEFVPDA